MARTDIDIDEDACAAVMRRYGLKTGRDAVSLARCSIARAVVPMTPAEAGDAASAGTATWRRCGRPVTFT